MSDGAIGNAHVTIPDLLEPVVGFRTFTIKDAAPAREAWDEIKWSGNPHNEPFREPNEFVTDPATGKLIKNYAKIAEAFKEWQASLGTQTIIHHPATEAVGGHLISPTKVGHVWKPGVNVADCLLIEGTEMHMAPHPNCQCGLYSYYDCPKLSVIGRSVSRVVGVVTQWGQIEAHATGMRSQFMKIEALLGNEAQLRTLASEWFDSEDAPLIFDNETTSCDEFASLASEFGSPLPETMRPKVTEEDIQKKAHLEALRLLSAKNEEVNRTLAKVEKRALGFQKRYYDPSIEKFLPITMRKDQWNEVKRMAKEAQSSNIIMSVDPVFTGAPIFVHYDEEVKPFNWVRFLQGACALVAVIFLVLGSLVPADDRPPTPSPAPSIHQRVDFKAPLSPPTNFLYER